MSAVIYCEREYVWEITWLQVTRSWFKIAYSEREVTGRFIYWWLWEVQGWVRLQAWLGPGLSSELTLSLRSAAHWLRTSFPPSHNLTVTAMGRWDCISRNAIHLDPLHVKVECPPSWVYFHTASTLSLTIWLALANRMLADVNKGFKCACMI